MLLCGDSNSITAGDSKGCATVFSGKGNNVDLNSKNSESVAYGVCSVLVRAYVFCVRRNNALRRHYKRAQLFIDTMVTCRQKKRSHTSKGNIFVTRGLDCGFC